MTSRAIHCGLDDCYRVQVLRYVGYEVTETKSLNDLSTYLQSDKQVDVVFLTEDDPSFAEQAVSIVRRSVEAPVILFRTCGSDLDASKFDKVYSSVVSPVVWLDDAAALLAKEPRTEKTSEGYRRRQFWSALLGRAR